MTIADVQPWETARLPSAVYGCANDFCAEIVCYSPEMIFWVDAYTDPDDSGEATAGWYCEDCLSYSDSPEPGTSLLAELERRTPARRDE